MAQLHVIEEVAGQLGYILKSEQKEVISRFVNGEDVFAVMPTGYGKSLCYQCLPLIFDKLRTDGLLSIIVVITPLTAIIRDQVHVKLECVCMEVEL